MLERHETKNIKNEISFSVSKFKEIRERLESFISINKTWRLQNAQICYEKRDMREDSARKLPASLP